MKGQILSYAHAETYRAPVISRFRGNEPNQRATEANFQSIDQGNLYPRIPYVAEESFSFLILMIVLGISKEVPGNKSEAKTSLTIDGYIKMVLNIRAGKRIAVYHLMSDIRVCNFCQAVLSKRSLGKHGHFNEASFFHLGENKIITLHGTSLTPVKIGSPSVFHCRGLESDRPEGEVRNSLDSDGVTSQSSVLKKHRGQDQLELVPPPTCQQI